MNKYFLILNFIFLQLFSSFSYAVSTKPVSGSVVNENAVNTLETESMLQNKMNTKWMRTKTGKVLIFDVPQKIAIVNNETYFVNDLTNIYDGQIANVKKGTRIKFNTNEKNVITELWILK